MKQGYKKIYSPVLLAVTYFLLLASLYISDYFPSMGVYIITFITSSLTFVVLLRMQNAIIFNNSSIDKSYEPESSFSGWETIFFLLGVTLIVLSMLS